MLRRERVLIVNVALFEEYLLFKERNRVYEYSRKTDNSAAMKALGSRMKYSKPVGTGRLKS